LVPSMGYKGQGYRQEVSGFDLLIFYLYR
jgi:hypothetical protein